MKKWFLYCLIIFTITSINSQTNLDSLWNVWQDKTKADTTRLKAIADYAWTGYIKSYPDSAFYFAQMQYDMAKLKGLKKYMSSALNTQGRSLSLQGKYSEALELYDRCIVINKKTLNIRGLAAIENNIGEVYREQGDYSKALRHHLKSLTYEEELNNKMGIAYSLNNIGLIYQSQGNVTKSLEYFLKALAIKEELGKPYSTSNSLISIGNVYNNQGDYPKALEYYKKSLVIYEKLSNKYGISLSLYNMANTYREERKYEKSLKYFRKSLKIREELGYKIGIAASLNAIGVIYNQRNDFSKALDYFQKSLKIEEELNRKDGIANLLNNIGILNRKNGNYSEALDYCKKGLDLSKSIGDLTIQKEACRCLYYTYKFMRKSSEALEYYEKYTYFKDSTFNEANTKKITQLAMQHEFDKKEAAVKMKQDKKDAIAAQELKRQRFVRNSFVGGFAVVSIFAFVFFRQRNVVKKEKNRSENLLLNILPAEIAEELKEKGKADARDFEMVSILFTDFKGFTMTSEKLTAQELVSEINTCFKAFDGIIGKYGIEKIKTIGDAYMAAGGLPVPFDESIKNTVIAALEMQEFTSERKARLDAEGKPGFDMRVGIHTGPVVAGIVGVKKFQYDIWGDTVNTASRMESSGAIGQVNISKATYDLIKGDSQFIFESRGEINAKGKGEMAMYFVKKASSW